METSHSHHLETHSDSYLVKIKPEIKLLSFDEVDISDLLNKRYEKIMSYGSI